MTEDTSKSQEEHRRAVGYSDSWDFREAFRDAVNNLPPDLGAGQIADQLDTVRVTFIGAEIGGIAGLNRLVVHVEG